MGFLGLNMSSAREHVFVVVARGPTSSNFRPRCLLAHGSPAFASGQHF